MQQLASCIVSVCYCNLTALPTLHACSACCLLVRVCVVLFCARVVWCLPDWCVCVIDFFLGHPQTPPPQTHQQKWFGLDFPGGAGGVWGGVGRPLQGGCKYGAITMQTLYSAAF